MTKVVSVRLQKKSIALLLLGILILLPVLVWFLTAESRETSTEVRRLVAQMNDSLSEESLEAQNRLIALGPKGYAELRRILTSSSRPNPLYARVWNFLPGKLRSQLPAPVARAELRHNLQASLSNLGPVHCRALCGAICSALAQPDPTRDEHGLLRALIWSLPESPRAVATLSNHVANVTNTFLFGSVYGHQVWEDLPHLASLLAEWLRNPNNVTDAAQGLATLGTNALCAVPLLVEIAELGIAREQVQPAITVSWYGGEDPVSINRAVAIHALGKIGSTNPGVIGALAIAAESKNDSLCFATLLASLRLDLPLTDRLRDWAEQWEPFSGFPAQAYRSAESLREMGKLRAKAQPAIPLLERVASGAGSGDANRFDHFDPRRADGLRITAISALYEIDPERAAPHLPFILERFSEWEAMNLLRQWREKRNTIVPEISKHLNDPKNRLQAAFILHGVAPELEEPLRILEQALKSDDLKTRATAVNWLWYLRKDAEQNLQTIRDLLKTGDDGHAQSALNALELMGDPARAATPELKPLLTSKHWTLRERAGRLLQKIAPEEMPPIVE